MTTPTSKPIRSNDVIDLKFNAEKIDEVVNSNAENYFDRFGVERYTLEGIRKNLSPLGKTYTQEQAVAAIASGEIPDGAFFFIWSDDEGAVAEKYQNVGGVITPTGVKISSEKFVQMVYQQALANLADISQLKNITSMLKNYTSTGWQFSLESKNGPSETLLGVDDNGELWLAGLVRGIQEYVEQLIPTSLANRYKGLQWALVDKSGKLGLITIDDDGGFYIPGIEGPLQDNLGESLATIKTENGVPAAAWRGNVVWSERPVLTAQKLTSTGFIFSYVPGGEATAGNGVKYEPSIREMPIDANEVHGGGSGGQSLNTPKDGAGINIVNRDPAFRGRVLVGANGRPEGGGMDPVSESDLSTLNDAQYPAAGWRQGNVLPMYYAILHQNPGNQVFIHAPFAAGGRSFAEISKGTIPYQNSLEFVQLGKNASDGVGKRYTFKFMTFEHGETDNDNGSSQNPGDYLAKMTPYFSGMQVDFKAITGQTENFAEVVGQVGSRINTKNQQVDDQGNPIGEPVIVQRYSVTATDQLTYVRQNAAKAIMYGPKYPLNWLYNDATLSHLNAAGKVLQGEYAAQAIYWHLYDPVKKGTWTGLKARSLSVNGSTIDIVFDVPYPPLVIDTTTIADCPGQGFSLQDASAEVQSVVVIAPNTIRLNLNQSPAVTDHLLIGFTNTVPATQDFIYPLVCLRDSSTQTSRWLTKNNQPFPLYNWACLDRLPLNGAF
ncbi:hypothetical protein [Serratia marcescens]|uniref:hypothetical protein n=1 Tax=Serratia marcescens TaxID=615 RepID=UPI00074524B5|nr:hypothetical protein [Serratia marcescens]CVE54102.1 Uncharacterised protein [Serratia marcescens]